MKETELIKNQLIEAVITGYNSEGYGIARVHGHAVFVEGGARGDEVILRIVKVTAKAVYAKIETMNRPSAARIEPVCGTFRHCGGCAYAHIDYKEEYSAKKQHIVNALTRIGGCKALPVIHDVPAENHEHYRNKALFPVADGPNGPCWGFYRSRSHDIVPLKRCFIQDLRACAAAEAVTVWMKKHRIDAYCENRHSGIIRHVFARTGTNGCLLGVVACGKPVQKDSLVAALRTACPDAVGIVWLDNRQPGNTVLQGNPVTLWGQPYLEEQLCGLTFRVGMLSFFQVNRIQAEKLYGVALDFAGGQAGGTVVDLYCGTGTLTLCLAQKYENVYGIETAAGAVADARENAARNKLTAKFIHADAAEGFAKLIKQGIKADTVVVDPPRKGLAPAVTAIIAAQAPEKIVYVSCNPATLARDVKLLQGYTLTRLAAVDMFPRTAHIECAALLTRNG
jgi:23S rRNA (uracil1939-C5)-methyltransferase